MCAPGCKDYLHVRTLASERAVAVQACVRVWHARVHAGVRAHAHARMAGGEVCGGLGAPQHMAASCRGIFARCVETVCVCVCARV